MELIHQGYQGLRRHQAFTNRDVDYVVNGRRSHLVDEFTGAQMTEDGGPTATQAVEPRRGNKNRARRIRTLRPSPSRMIYACTKTFWHAEPLQPKPLSRPKL